MSKRNSGQYVYQWIRRRTKALSLLFAAFLMLFGSLVPFLTANASSIAPVSGSASVTNTGRSISFASSDGSTVTIDNWSRKMAGHAWSQELGWIDFGSDQNPVGPVRADKTGVLSGKALVINDGSYIEFATSGAQVQIVTGVFSGYAWSAELGWINMTGVNAPGYNPDITTPVTNASNVQLTRGQTGPNVTSNGWINQNMYFSWTAGADEGGGSGIAGYCLYLGHDPTGNPMTTKGNLGTGTLDTDGTCQFAVNANHLDTTVSGMIGTALDSSSSPYYLNVLAVDNANNVYNGSSAQFQFRYDTVSPSNPDYVSAPSQFVADKDVNLTWPTTGDHAASDNLSSVAGLQYRIGSGGTWYGANHTGASDCSDLLGNNGSYTLQSSPDFSSLHEGENIIYFRTWDSACNVSATTITTVVKINTSAPSSPQNLTVTPATNTLNSFAFSWSPPATFEGSVSGVTYCYSVNTLPTVSTCTFTPAGATTLPSGAYATQPGDNTFYIVAKDEAGNINYATVASVTFTANTSAPGIPQDIDLADVSVKASSVWKLALSWEPPATLGAGVAKYQVDRSANGTAFTTVATTSGTSYVDGGLNQQTYYYRVKACDSANNCGAPTETVNMYPTGKFTTPATKISGPDVSVMTRSATINWTTDRASNSQVEYGLSSGHYFPTVASKLAQETSHAVTLNNLEAATTYYYRILWTDSDGNTGMSSEQKLTTLEPPKISDVAASNINLHDATVTFTVKGASSVKLSYGPYGSLTGSKTINTSTNESTYSIPLGNLTDATTYMYRIDPVDVSGYTYTNPTSLSFTTPAAPHITNIEFEPVSDALTGSEQITWTTNIPTTSAIQYSKRGQSLSEGREAIDSKLSTTHTMTIENLDYSTLYQIIARSQDALGNVAVSDLQIFHTGLDTRPPKLSKLTVQASVNGTGSSATGQIIVSWKTDKPAMSQVAYGQGSGNSYGSKTARDNGLVLNHVVVISNLPTSQVFHVQAISQDQAGNIGTSSGQTTIVGQATDSALDIVFNSLRAIFGL